MDALKKGLNKYLGISTVFIVVGVITFFIFQLSILAIPLIIVGIVFQIKNIRKIDQDAQVNDLNHVDHLDELNSVSTGSPRGLILTEKSLQYENIVKDSPPAQMNSIQEYINEGKVPIHSFRLDGTPIYWQEDGVKYYAPTKKRVYRSIKIGKRGRIGKSQTIQSWSRIGIGKLQITPDGFTFITEMGMDHFSFSEIADIDMASDPTGIRLYMKNGKAVVFNFQNATEMFTAIDFYRQVAPTWQLIKEPMGGMLVQRLNNRS